MGLDRFSNFISKSINNEGIEEIYINNNTRKVVSSHIIFDLNFLIYQEILNLENELNDIIKIILCLPFSMGYHDEIEELIKNIFMQKHWKPYYIGTDLENILDGFNEDEIITKFINYICNKNIIPKTEDSTIEHTYSLSIIEYVTYEKIINTLIDYIEKIHQTSFIQNISIFFDGIPSFSKVIEQRRRRMKNYLESNEKKKLFKKYFDNLISSNRKLIDDLSQDYKKTLQMDISLDNLIFDYFKWVKNRFSIDKSISPSSDFIKSLELFMNEKIKNVYSKINIRISSGRENGESDLKIFKFISQNEINGDYSIHTTDSDLIHQMLVQQSYYKILNKDINISVIKYLRGSSSYGFVQILDGNLIIKNIMELYNQVNNLKTCNYKIIWDLCLIFFLFGNDHLPSSIEIGPELGLEFYIKKHYEALEKNNVISLKKSYIYLDLKNLALFLEKINETKKNNINRIILQRFFKINNLLISLFVDKFNLGFEETQEFIKKFIIYQAAQMDKQQYDKLYEQDLRKNFTKNINLELFKDISIFNLNKFEEKLLLDSINLINSNIDFYEEEFNGLILYSRPQNITKDPYQDLYDYISEKTINNLSKKYPKYYDHIDISAHLQYIKNIDSLSQNESLIRDWLKKIYHLSITQFGNMKDYHTDNLTFFKYYNIPSISSLIQYIRNIPEGVNLTKEWLAEIKEDNIEANKYLNSINHHLIITPFISAYPLPESIQKIIRELEPINNLWVESIDTFDYRNIDPKLFFKKWNEALIRINMETKSSKINDEIINLNYEFV
jgi:hypothetical protein